MMSDLGDDRIAFLERFEGAARRRPSGLLPAMLRQC